jgi:serine/threonine-protein kinase
VSKDFNTGGGLKDAAGLIWKQGESRVGETIGGYRLIELIGQGGMGVVYRARPADERLDRDVAIKLLPSGPALESLAQRLIREAEIQSRMSHPNITRLYDAGVSEGGLPFLVMEIVDGEPIDTYCESQQLSTRQRVKLVREIASAIASAHSNLVLHRDIKPSNVLIAEGGQPKLLDFGIATLIGEQVGDVTKRTLALTPTYASPEQLTGKRSSIATDVYQLGLLLFQVLSGKSLFGDQDVATAIERAVRDETVHLPADAKAQMDNELQAIILKCVQTDPAARYSDANALNEDLGRYLNGYPIAASAPRWWTPAVKLVRRNPWISMAFATLAVTLIAGNFLYLDALRSSREEARIEAQRATAVTEFLVETFETSAPGGPMSEQATARNILDAGAKSLDAQLTDQPALRAQILFTIGRLYLHIGDYDQSERLLLESLSLGEQVHGADHESLANVHKALSQMYAGPIQQAESAVFHIQESLRIHEKHHGIDADYAQLLALLASIETWERERYDVALQLLLEADGIQGRLLDDGDPDRINILSGLASVYSRLNQLENAEASGSRALRLAESNFGLVHAKVHGPLHILARVLLAEGRLEEAAALFQRDLELLISVNGQDHPETANAYLNVANVLRRLGRSEDALPAAKEALVAFERSLGKAHTRYAHAASQLAGLLQETDNIEAAEPLLLEAIAIYESIHGPQHTYTAYGLKAYGDYLFRLGRFDETRVQFARAHQIRMAVNGADHPQTALTAVSLGAVDLELGNLDEAETYFYSALAIQEKALGADHPRLENTLSYIGWLHISQERWDSCEKPIRRALKISETVLPSDHPSVISTKNALDLCLAKGST